jgi:hypothetical protein
MEEITKLHKKALEFADKSALKKLDGDYEAHIKFIKEAFELEKEAALKFSEISSEEPSRSVLLRSAASYALEINEFREAEKLVNLALSQDTPEDLAEELRDLLEEVYFKRHLKLRGITLQANEFQLSLTGKSIGFGIAQSEEFVDRVKDMETLIFRTAERKLGKPFREKGRRKESLKEELELFVSIPRAASFAVTFHLGSKEQLLLPGIAFSEEVVDELLDCLDLLEKDEEEELKKKIPEEAYFTNFVGLANKIAPDGENITGIGLTKQKKDEEKYILLKKPKSRIRKKRKKKEEKIEVEGYLKFADTTRQEEGIIEIVEDGGRIHKFKVPTGMMGDIVRPLFDFEVVVTGYLEKGHYRLENIERK